MVGSIELLALRMLSQVSVPSQVVYVLYSGVPVATTQTSQQIQASEDQMVTDDQWQDVAQSASAVEKSRAPASADTYRYEGTMVCN